MVLLGSLVHTRRHSKPRKFMRTACIVFYMCYAALIADIAAAAETLDGPLNVIVVTATRIPEPLDRIPADISVVSGEELVPRGAWCIPKALRLAPGGEGTP